MTMPITNDEEAMKTKMNAATNDDDDDYSNDDDDDKMCQEPECVRPLYSRRKREADALRVYESSLSYV